MALQVSTGFKERLLDGVAWKDIFNNGVIYLFQGMRPTISDFAPGTPPIAIITSGGAAWNPSFTVFGLKFIRSGPNILFETELNAQITVTDNATATWWRLVTPADNLETSYFFPRIDGDVGLKASPSGQELLLDSTALTLGDAIPVGYFLYTIPPILGV
jgi:hypothetical protein